MNDQVEAGSLELATGSLERRAEVVSEAPGARIAEEQLVYARVLDGGMKLGMLVLMGTFATEVGGLLREQGYSSIQTMHFAQTVSGAINLLAPSQRLTVDIRTGEKKWIVTNDLLEGLKALAGDRKVITVPRGSENIVEAATQKPAPTTPVTPALEPKVAIALQSPGLDGTVTTLGTRQAMPENGQLVALPVAARQGMTEAGPTVMPEMETAVMLGFFLSILATIVGVWIAGRNAVPRNLSEE